MKKSILAYVLIFSALGGSVAFAQEDLVQKETAKSKYATFIETVNSKISNIKLDGLVFKSKIVYNIPKRKKHEKVND